VEDIQVSKPGQVQILTHDGKLIKVCGEKGGCTWAREKQPWAARLPYARADYPRGPLARGCLQSGGVVPPESVPNTA